MSKKDEALKLALEALDHNLLFTSLMPGYDGRVIEKAYKAINKVLAEQPAQQGPVAWRWTESNGQHWFDWRTDWTHHDRAKAMGFAIEYAYTSPPAQRTWVGLTDKEIDALREKHSEGRGAGWRFDFKGFARAIEAAHGITGEMK